MHAAASEFEGEFVDEGDAVAKQDEEQEGGVAEGGGGDGEHSDQRGGEQPDG